MFKQLKASLGKNVVIELANGRIISGAVLSVDQQSVCIQTIEGKGSIPLQSVFIVWEALKRSELGEPYLPLQFGCEHWIVGQPCIFGFGCSTFGFGQPCPFAFGCSTFGFV